MFAFAPPKLVENGYALYSYGYRPQAMFGIPINERDVRILSRRLKASAYLWRKCNKDKYCQSNKELIPWVWVLETEGHMERRTARERAIETTGKIRTVTSGRVAMAVLLSVTVAKVNQILYGWINYKSIGSLKGYMAEVG